MRHQHARLVERWAAVVGPERLTVIVPDESDPDMLLRSFEGLLALPHGVLRRRNWQENRSLSWDEVELVRRCNERSVDGALPERPESVPIEAAVEAVVGAVDTAARKRLGSDLASPVEEAPAKELPRVLVRRVVRRAGRRFGACWRR